MPDNCLADLNARLRAGEDVRDLLPALRETWVGPRTVAMAQLNPVVGDLAGNARKIIARMTLAEALDVEVLAFPELALMGYPIRDVITRHPFLVEENLKWLQVLAERSGETAVLVGFVEPRNRGGGKRIGKPFYNALAVLRHGKIQGIVRKSLLPTYAEFEDDRTFERSPAPGLFPAETLAQTDWLPNGPGSLLEVNGRRYGLTICEDLWSDPDFFSQPGHRVDPVAAMMAQKPDVLLNVSASPTRSRKEQLKHTLLGFLAKKYATPLVYVNQAGSIDEVAFDGGSRAYAADGTLIARAPLFAEHFTLVNLPKKQGEIAPLPVGLDQTLSAAKGFDAYDETDLGRTYEALIQGIRDYFAKTGFHRAVLGLSGGLDSSVVVTLLVDTLGAENVLGVSMPSGITPQENREDVEAIARNLGITLVEAPIGAIVDQIEAAVEGVRTGVEAAWGAASQHSNARDNAQAITRATLLRQLGNDYRAFPVATSDKSEFYLGYATVNGDMSGALAPIGDVPKTKVRALARWLNQHRATKYALPERVITKPSGADLKVDPVTGKLVTASTLR